QHPQGLGAVPPLNERDQFVGQKSQEVLFAAFAVALRDRHITVTVGVGNRDDERLRHLRYRRIAGHKPHGIRGDWPRAFTVKRVDDRVTLPGAVVRRRQVDLNLTLLAEPLRADSQRLADGDRSADYFGGFILPLTGHRTL